VASQTPTVVYVPTQLALVYTAARGWHLATPAPAWWYDELDAECAPARAVLPFSTRVEKSRRAAGLRPAPVKPSRRRIHRRRRRVAA
jgi:hypothetical protein